VLLFTSTLSVYLLYHFIQEPNTQILSFFLAVLTLSVTLMLYNQYKRYLKKGGVISFIEWFIWILKSRKNYIALIITYILLIYAIVMVIIHPLERALYLMYVVMLISTSVLLYYPKERLVDVLKFYAGMAALMYSILLFFELASVSATLMGEKYRVLDIFIGLCIILLIKINEDRLGVGVKPLKKMITEAKE
jgi:hypothetical protein